MFTNRPGESSSHCPADGAGTGGDRDNTDHWREPTKPSRDSINHKTTEEHWREGGVTSRLKSVKNTADVQDIVAREKEGSKWCGGVCSCKFQHLASSSGLPDVPPSIPPSITQLLVGPGRPPWGLRGAQNCRQRGRKRRGRGWERVVRVPVEQEGRRNKQENHKAAGYQWEGPRRGGWRGR